MGAKGILPFFNLNKAKEDMKPKGEKMKDNLQELKVEMNNYYFNRILQLLDGSHRMGSGVIVLEKIKGWYGYYGIDDTIVYYDKNIAAKLYEEGIASYNDSTGSLVVTTAEYRVNQMKK